MTKAKSPVHRVPYRRRREGKTDFEKRLRFIKSKTPRLVVRRSNKSVIVQVIEFDPKGDKTLLSINAKAIEKKYKWPAKRNVWTAYLTGLYAGKMATKHKIKKVISDVGRYTPSKGSVVFAALQGAIDGGIEMKVHDEKVPTDKIGNPPDTIKKTFEDLKKKIMAG